MMSSMEVLVQIPFALELIAADATVVAQLFTRHVNVFKMLLEVAGGTIGALADWARQRV